MEITKGKIAAPIRAVVYGPEGIGKTTFASHWPTPLFIDVEKGTVRLDVSRITPNSAAALGAVIDELAKDAKGYATLVIDTADWTEKLLVESILAGAGKASIEDFGYGKGYTHVEEAWRKLLDRLTAMQAKNGMHILFLAHSCLRKFEQPDETGSYDRWEMKLSKKSPAILKEWADMVLFLNYRTVLITTEDKKVKAQGGKRIIATTHHVCWDAKNRFDFPGELALPPAGLPKEISALFDAATAPTAKPTPVPAAKPTPAPAPEKPAAPTPTAPKQEPKAATAPATAPEDPEKAKLLDQLRELMKTSQVTRNELCAELGRKGIVPADMSPLEYNVPTLNRIVANWDKVLHNITTIKNKGA
jgi:hypothetical protein